jgi:hypothetical protein
MGGSLLETYGSRQGKVTGCCDNGDESFVSINVKNFITLLGISSFTKELHQADQLCSVHWPTRNSVECLRNFPPAEHRYSEQPTVSLTSI